MGVSHALLVFIVGLVVSRAEVVSKTAAARADSNKIPGSQPPSDRVLLILTAPFGTGFVPGSATYTVGARFGGVHRFTTPVYSSTRMVGVFDEISSELYCEAHQAPWRGGCKMELTISADAVPLNQLLPSPPSPPPTPAPPPPPAFSSLNSAGMQELLAGRALFSSNGLHSLLLTVRGQLLLIDVLNERIVWTNRVNASVSIRHKLICQDDGNLVLYDDGQPFWKTDTQGNGKGPYRLLVQDDGNLVLYDSTNTAIWASHTKQ